MVGRVLVVFLFAFVAAAQDDLRSHHVQHFPGDTAPIVSTVIRTGERGRTIVLLARSQATGDQLVAKVPEGSIEVSVEGVDPIALKPLNAWQAVWSLSYGEKSWAVSASMSEEELLPSRQALRDAVDRDFLWIIDELTDRSPFSSLWQALICPRTPEKNDEGDWGCAPLVKASMTTIAPDCEFDASFGYPCDGARAAAVRAAAERGELLKEY